MKALIAILLSAMVFTLPARAQAPAPAAKPGVPPAKLTARDIRVHPFAGEHREVKFKSNTRELPDELTVTRAEKIRFYGKKRTDGAPSVRGVPVGNVGQLALLPPGERAGNIAFKSVLGSMQFFAVLELPEDTLESKHLELKVGKIHAWNVKTENGTTTLSVFGPDGTKLGSTSADTSKVLGVGFAVVVRHKGNEVDVTITYE